MADTWCEIEIFTASKQWLVFVRLAGSIKEEQACMKPIALQMNQPLSLGNGVLLFFFFFVVAVFCILNLYQL